MSWSISKGETYIIDEGKRLKFSGATLYRYYIKAVFILTNDLLERVIVRNIDNRDCMYIGGVLHFSDKAKVDKLINAIIDEII